MTADEIAPMIFFGGLLVISAIALIITKLAENGFFDPIGDGLSNGRHGRTYNNVEEKRLPAFFYDKGYILGKMFPYTDHGELYNEKRNKD